MAGKFVKKLVIAVTNGDALSDNRLTGKSNTGTYFICSAKDYNKFKDFLEEREYLIDSFQVVKYQHNFKKYYYEKRNDYNDKMKFFDSFCDNLISKDEIKVKVGLRQNDSRYFMRFNDNENSYVNSFRHILYGELTEIVLEIRDDKCYIYPDVILQSTALEKDEFIYID